MVVQEQKIHYYLPLEVLENCHLSFYQKEQGVVGQQELEILMPRQGWVVAVAVVLKMPLAWHEEEVVEVEEVQI